ncbi:hypothetical protein Tco_0018749 [Tanacetum coccineum]
MPAYKPIMKFLRNCPLYNAFTNCPSVVYQNFLRDFWSTVVAFVPFPSTDELEKRPLKEFLIKFLVLNGQRPLTLDFHTFCSSTGLNYNNGKYVDHPIPEVVKKELGNNAIYPSYLDKTLVLKISFPAAWRILFTFVIQVLGGNYSSTEQVNSIQQLLAYNLITGIEVDIGESSYSDLITTILKKFRLKYFHDLHLSHVPFTSVLLMVLNTLRMKNLDRGTQCTPPPHHVTQPPLPPCKQTPLPPTTCPHNPHINTLFCKSKEKESLQTVASPYPIHMPMGLPSTLDEGTRKSKPLPESIATHPKDSRGNKQPFDRDITSTTPDEGMAKTTSHPKGSLGDKDSGGNIPPADIEPIHNPVSDPSGTAFLLFDDELDKESDEEEVLAAGDDMDEDPQDDAEVRTPSPDLTQPKPSHVQESAFDSSSPDLKKFDNILPLTERQLIKYLRKMSRVLLNRITKKQWEQHEEAAVSYTDLKASIDKL